MKAIILLLSCSLLALSGVAHAKRLKPAAASASSEYPADAQMSYEAAKVMDGKLSTSWVEGEEGSGLGSWLELDLGEERTVKQIRIWAGMWYSHNYWERANRPKEIEVRWSDGTDESFPLADEMKVQVIDLATPKATTKLQFRIKQVYSGTTWLDTAISEVQIIDGEPDEFLTVSSATASSRLPADADGDYEPYNVTDGLSDSMWCEGSASGDGTGEWVQFDFGTMQDVSKVKLVNGNGTSLSFWMAGNRATAATLSFSDGTKEKVTLKNTMLPQEIAFPEHRTSSVRVTLDEIVRGKEYNDMCFAEISFPR